jgi:hypothetical protein
MITITDDLIVRDALVCQRSHYEAWLTALHVPDFDKDVAPRAHPTYRPDARRDRKPARPKSAGELRGAVRVGTVVLPPGSDVA